MAASSKSGLCGAPNLVVDIQQDRLVSERRLEKFLMWRSIIAGVRYCLLPVVDLQKCSFAA